MAARGGFSGLWARSWIDLSCVATTRLDELAGAPGSAIGSSRDIVDDAALAQAADALRAHNTRVAFLSGGNGTMRTAHRLQLAVGATVQVIGIPKTIDNDIPGLPWTPGYGSVARFFAHAARDAGEDNRSLPSPVMVLETLGRDTGWVTAATALARHHARDHEDDAPHLIYLPERPVSLEKVCADVDGVLHRLGRCVISVCEGMKDEHGEPFGADVQRDRDGVRRLSATLGHSLAVLIHRHLNVRARSEKPGLVGRCFAALASEPDRALSFQCGQQAARAAAAGQSGIMVNGQGGWVSLEEISGELRQFPQHWIAQAGNDVDPGFVEWLRPIIGVIAEHPRL
jgi:6-phosphofructokinase 1